MKKILFIMILFAAFFSADAKDYIPIRQGNVSFFTNKQLEILAVRIDSVKNINNQVFNILNRTWNDEDYNCVKPNGPSWLGPHFIEATDSLYYFFNKNNDTIKIKPFSSLNSSFNFYRFQNGEYIQATLSNIAFEEFLGLNDSVKHFTLEHFDASGNKINDSITGTEFTISQNHGFVKIFDILNFPESIINYTLSGTTNPKAGKTYLSPNEIFDFEIGDEFHSTYDYSEYDYGWINRQSISIVIDKNYSQNFDSVYYLYKITTKSHENTKNLKKQLDTIYSGIKNVGYCLNKFFYLPSEPLPEEIQYCQTKGFSFFYNKSQINERRALIPSTAWYYTNNDTCWEDVLADGVSYPVYLEGCGLFIERATPFGNLLNSEFRLVYYKKGNETWGTPLTFTDIIDSPQKQFQLFPNPFQNIGQLTIRNSEPMIKICILDLLGRERVNQKIEHQFEYKINLDDIESGIYFIVITDIKNNIKTEKLIVE